MPGRTSILLLALTVSTAGAALAQPASGPSELELGKAAMEAHDPATAIAHFEKADGRAARAWLAVALMMESRSQSDQYVERAFEAAAQSRSDGTEPPQRTELAAALRPGEMVIAFLVGEQHAYAWAYDRDVLIGYPLPPPAEIATAVERVTTYAAQNDQAGVQRIADDLVPALLGPVADRLPALKRVIFVLDQPMRQLPMRAMLSGQRQLAVSSVDDASLAGEISRPPAPPDEAPAGRVLTFSVIVIGVALLLAGIVVARRRRSLA